MNGQDTQIHPQQYGTNAERLALPAGTIKPFSEWYETDTANAYVWLGAWTLRPALGSVTIPLISGEDELNNLLRVLEVGGGSQVMAYGDGTGATGNTPTGLLWKITRTQFGVVQVQTLTYVANTLSSTGYVVATISDWV